MPKECATAHCRCKIFGRARSLHSSLARTDLSDTSCYTPMGGTKRNSVQYVVEFDMETRGTNLSSFRGTVSVASATTQYVKCLVQQPQSGRSEW